MHRWCFVPMSKRSAERTAENTAALIMNRVSRHVPLLAWRWIDASRSNNIVVPRSARCRRRKRIHSPRLSIDDTESELEYASIRPNESEWMRFLPGKPASRYWHKSRNGIRFAWCCNTSLFIAIKFYDNFTEIWKPAAYRESRRYISAESKSL